VIHTQYHRYYIHEIPVPGRPLGRHVDHDPESLGFAHRLSGAAPETIVWTRYIPILDQGQVGSCTANAEVGCLGTAPLYGALTADQQHRLNETLALDFYSAEEVLDGNGPYPPSDFGSSGLTAAKVAKARGYTPGYTHILSLPALVDALQLGPVAWGTNWYDSCDNPGPSGELVVSPGAQVRGGHELVLRGVDAERREFYGDNSWGEGWGLKGSFRIGYATMDRLLGEDGDATRTLPLTAPLPISDPDLAYDAVMGPWARQTRTRPDLIQVQQATLAWEKAKIWPTKLR
jgi:hypothetical protein